VIKGGILLTREQTVRLAVVGSVDRDKLIKAIVEEMRTKARETERSGTKRA
jgi:hypothetical protein